jgi:mycothiol synthase
MLSVDTFSSLDDVSTSARTFVAHHQPIRGDEVLTEQLADALSFGGEMRLCGIVLEHAVAGETVGVAVALQLGIDPQTGMDTWVIETVGPPTDLSAHEGLAQQVWEHIAAVSSGPLSLRWRPPSTTGKTATPGLPWRLERSVVEMRASLPLVGRSSTEAGSWRIGPFDAWSTAVDRDLHELVQINNRAFADHPEQGKRSLADFQQRLAADWCGGRGVVVARDGDDRIGGFAWMKCIPFRPAELYVIAVDPNVIGTGLGRRLVRAGFEHTVKHHDTTTAMLFVELGNQRARSLYRSMGFRHIRHQSVYVRTLQ